MFGRRVLKETRRQTCRTVQAFKTIQMKWIAYNSRIRFYLVSAHLFRIFPLVQFCVLSHGDKVLRLVCRHQHYAWNHDHSRLFAWLARARFGHVVAAVIGRNQPLFETAHK